MQHRKCYPLADQQQGVVLIEVLVSILIFSTGVLAIVGLQAAMVKNTSESMFRIDASYVAQQRIGQIWADPDNAATFVEDSTDVSLLLPSGTRSTTLNGCCEFTVTVNWQQPGGDVRSYVAVANIVGG